MDEINKRLEGAAIAAALLLGAFLIWRHYLPQEQSPGYHPAQKAPEVAQVGTETIQCPKGIQVLKPEAKGRLGLPDAVKNDSHIHVADTAKIPANDHPSTAVITFDDATGRIDTQIREDPLPWLAAENKFRVRIGPGFKTGSGQVWRLGGDWNAIQTKALHLGADGTIDTDGKGYAGLHLELQF